MQVGTLKREGTHDVINLLNQVINALAGLSHVFPKNQANPDAITLRNMTFDGNATGLFTTKKDILMNHYFADIFEANFYDFYLQTIMFTELLNLWRNRKSN